MNAKIIQITIIALFAVLISSVSFMAGSWSAQKSFEKEINTISATFPRYLDEEQQVKFLKHILDMARLTENEENTLIIKEFQQSRKVEVE